MFVPRKRAIVPPSLPSCGGKTAAAVAATAPPALAAVAGASLLRHQQPANATAQVLASL